MAAHMSTVAKAMAVLLTERGEGDLVAAVLEREDTGQSWREIAFWLFDVTGIRVSHESVRSWAKEWRHQTSAGAAA